MEQFDSSVEARQAYFKGKPVVGSGDEDTNLSPPKILGMRLISTFYCVRLEVL